MNEGLTGLDPESALMAITAFEDEGNKVYKEMYDASKTFLNSLATVWYSEHAEAFGRESIPALYEAQEQIKIEFNNAIVAAVGAYNALAQGNGIPDSHQNESFEDLSGTASNSYFTEGEGFKNVSPTGKTGLGLDTAQKLLETFTNTVYQIVIPHLQSIPYVIAFYDPANEMQNAWKTTVANLVKKLEDAVTLVSNTYSSKLTEEMVDTKTSANASTEAMNNTTA